jgi:hypothetical protein
MTETTKLSGLYDPRLGFKSYSDWSFELSGRKALERTSNLLSRITPKRFEEFRSLLDHVKFFGGKVELIHKGDFFEEEAMEEYVYAKTNEHTEKGEENTVMGSYRQGDHWITIPVDVHSGWGTLETTLRHELIHLLQDVVTPFEEKSGTRPLGIITDRVKWGDYMATAFRSHCESLEDPAAHPLHEVEAHTLDTWVKSVREWAEEIEKSDMWHNNWRCPVQL